MTAVIGQVELWLGGKKLTTGVIQQSCKRKLGAANNWTTIIPPIVKYS